MLNVFSLSLKRMELLPTACGPTMMTLKALALMSWCD